MGSDLFHPSNSTCNSLCGEAMTEEDQAAVVRDIMFQMQCKQTLPFLQNNNSKKKKKKELFAVQNTFFSKNIITYNILGTRTV